MKLKHKRNLYMLLVTVLWLIGTLFTGCSFNPVDNSRSAEKTAGSKKVELQFWTVGESPKDLELINKEINKLTEMDLNCTVKFNMTTWTDHMQKYYMLLSAGQPIDLIFTSEWMDYQRYAKAGAFLPLDELVPKVAPELWNWIPKEYWDGVRVNGKIMTIPSTWKEYVTDGILYRKDLVKKYNLAEPNSIETMEAYFDAIKKYEKEMIPLGDYCSDCGNIRQLLHPWLDKNMPYYGLVADNLNPSGMKPYWGTSEHLSDLQLKKRWADRGYWSQNILFEREDPQVLFDNGKVAAYISNPNKYGDSLIRAGASHPDWEIGYYPFSFSTKVAHPVHPVHNGIAVPKNSRNHELAIAFYSKMVLDKRYNYLTQYGIEGKHYKIEEGNYKMIGNQETNGFVRESMCSWAWRNPDIMLYDKSFEPVSRIFDDIDKFSTPDIFNGFSEDYTPYQTERAALEQVKQQYLIPLEAGFSDDVEADLKEFMKKAEAADLNKIQAEYTKQWEEYCRKNSIK